MATECYFCRNMKDFNCDNCGLPICINHIIEQPMGIFCSKECRSEYNFMCMDRNKEMLS